MAHKVQPSVGNASSLFGSSADGGQGDQDDFLSGLSSGASSTGRSAGLKVNPFDAIGEEIEISESEEHLFQPQEPAPQPPQPAASSAATSWPYQPVSTPSVQSQQSQYAAYAPASTSSPYSPPNANPYRATSPPAYQSRYTPNPSVSPYGIPNTGSSSHSGTLQAQQQQQPRPASAISRKQVDAYDPPMPPPNKLSRAKSSHALAQQHSASPYGLPQSRPQSPYASPHQLPSMPPPLRRGSTHSGYSASDEPQSAFPLSRPPSIPPSLPSSSQQRTYSPPPAAVPRPASRSSLNRSVLGGPSSQPAYQPSYPAQYQPQSQYQPTSRPASRLAAEDPPGLRFQPPSPAREPVKQHQTTPRLQQEGFAPQANQDYSPSQDDPEGHKTNHVDWQDYGMSYPMDQKSSESGSTAGSAGDSSPDYNRRSASTMGFYEEPDTTIEPPPIRRNASETTIGWTPELASQSSFQPLQPLGSPPISPTFPKRPSYGAHTPAHSSQTIGARAASPYEPQPAQSTPPLQPPPMPYARTPSAPSPSLSRPPPKSYFSSPPAQPQQLPTTPLAEPSRILSPPTCTTPQSSVPAPAPPAHSFDYKPSSSMTGIKDATTAETTGRDASVRSPYPVAAFGFGGKLVTSFPSATSQGFYGNGGASVKVQELNEVVPQPLLEHFPGPLFVVPKSNPAKTKKDVAEWLHGRSSELDKEITFHRGTGKEDKRRKAEDMLLLLRVLTIMVEHDGKLVGVPDAEKAAREAMVPEDQASFTSVSHLQTLQPAEGPIATVELRASDLDQIQKLLLLGQRRDAVHFATEKRLWAHAFILASSIDKDSWQDVVQQFIQAEMTGRSDRSSLRLAYGLFAGRAAAAVEGLLPPGQSLPDHIPGLASAPVSAPMSRAGSPGPYPATPDRARFAEINPQALDSWRDSAAMIFANPTTGSSAALTSLGDVLSANGRHFAAHICYLLSPATSPIGAVPGGRIVLLGQPSPVNSPSVTLETESILLTEVLEFALSLTPTVKGQEPFSGLPYLHAYRLKHASLATDISQVQAASKYCDSIAGALKITAKSTPFINATLLSRTKELVFRATGVPSKADAGSWMSRKMPPKPTLDSLWNTLEGRFTSFVAGESDDASASPAAAASSDGSTGPFAQYSLISAETVGQPNRSKSQPDLRRASESQAAPPPIPRLPPNIPSKATSLPPGPPPMPAPVSMPAHPPPQPPASTPAQPPQPMPAKPPQLSRPSIPSAPAPKRGHAHKRSQSMGFMAYGSDPYGAAPSWAPPRRADTLAEEEPLAEENEEQSPRTPQAAPQSNGWWGAAGYGSSHDGSGSNHNDTSSFEAPSGGKFISPMGSTSASPASFAAPAPAQQTIEEEEDLEDLGFGNNSSRRKKQADDGHQRASSEGATAASDSPPVEAKPTPAPELKSSGSSSFLGRWFRRADTGTGPVKAKLGEATSMTYDPVQKKWIMPGAAGSSSGNGPAAGTPPPPRAQTASPAGLGPPLRPASSQSSLKPGGTPAPPSALSRSASALDGPPPPRSASTTPAPPASSGPPSGRGTPPASTSTTTTATSGDPPMPPPGAKRPGVSKKPTRNKYIVVD